MKTQFSIRFSILLLAAFIMSHSFAQNTAGTELAIAVAKGSTIADTALNTDTKKSIDMMNVKVQRSFTSYFKNATDVNWYMTGKQFLIAFNKDGMYTRALFSKNGSLLYALHYGSEKDLPNSIYEQVKSTYYNYQIISTVQVNNDRRNIWIVNLKDNTNYITLRVENGEMEVMQQFHESAK